MHALLHNDNDYLTQDRCLQDNLTHGQMILICWHLHLAHADMESIKNLAVQGLLPKEITNADPLLCTCCIQTKCTCTSLIRNATRNFIKSSNIRPGDKISCDRHMSREPGVMGNS